MAIAAGLGIWWQLREPAPPAMVAADGTPTDDPTLAMPLGPTIAVLPFTNFGGNPEDEYFSDGITEEIITELARFKNARVLARNSTFQYKGRAVDVRDIGRELGADFVIEGSVRRAGETVRVTAQLLDTRDGTHLWADTWERQLTLDNIFAIQDEITENVAATVAGTYGVVAMSGASEAMHRSSESLSAYECVLRAKWYNAESLGREDHLKVRSCLEQAVQTDPGYADAWAWLAFVYTNEYSFGHNARPEPLARALDAALTAVKLSPHSGDVQRHLTMVYYFHRDRTAFVEAANRAVALTPNDPVVLAETGLMLGFSGEWDRGADLMKKAIALSPTPAGYFYNFLTTYYYHRKEYDEALTWAVKVDQPTFHWPWVNRAAVYGQLGQLAEARGDLEKLETIYPNFGEHARSEYGTWMWNDADVEHFLDGLRLAGLEIPDPAPE